MTFSPLGSVTVYWQPDAIGILAWLPGIGFDIFDSFSQLDHFCIVEFFGYHVEFVRVMDEEHRLQLEAQGAFRE